MSARTLIVNDPQPPSDHYFLGLGVHEQYAAAYNELMSFSYFSKAFQYALYML